MDNRPTNINRNDLMEQISQGLSDEEKPTISIPQNLPLHKSNKCFICALNDLGETYANHSVKNAVTIEDKERVMKTLNHIGRAIKNLIPGTEETSQSSHHHEL